MLVPLSLAKHKVISWWISSLFYFFHVMSLISVNPMAKQRVQLKPQLLFCYVIISAHPLFYHIVHFIWCSEPFCYDTCWYGTYDIVTSPRFLSYFASVTLQAVWKAFTPVRKAYLTHMLELLQNHLAEMSCKFKAAYWIFRFIYSQHRSINLFHSDVIFSVWKKNR